MKFFLTAAAVASAVDLDTWDDSTNWKTEIDPVMGGVSEGSATVENGHGILDGEVKLIPSLQAPGFIQGQAKLSLDASSAANGDLVMMVRSSTPDYAGFKMAFAASSLLGLGCTGPSSRGCYKAPFMVPAGDDFTEVRIPLSEFSDKWNAATGELTTLCKDDPSVCPSADKLKKVQRLAVWAEGVAGKVHIEFDKVSMEPPAFKTESEIRLASFDGTKETSLSWKKTLDPVMGGASTGDFTITEAGTGKFSGTCNIVKSLKAPGFAKIEGTGRTLADITGTDSLLLKVRSSTPDYQGFKVAFGAPGVPSTTIFQRSGAYKTEFFLSATNDWQVVQVPLGNFSRDTSDYTGRCDTKDPRTGGKQHYCCSTSPLTPSKDEVCVESKYLSKINDLQIWAEGVEGDFDLEIEWIGANPSTIVV